MAVFMHSSLAFSFFSPSFLYLEVAKAVLNRCIEVYDPNNGHVLLTFEFIEDFKDVNASTERDYRGYTTDWGPTIFTKANHPLSIMVR